MREVTEQSENEKRNEDVCNSEGRIKNVEASRVESSIYHSHTVSHAVSHSYIVFVLALFLTLLCYSVRSQ